MQCVTGLRVHGNQLNAIFKPMNEYFREETSSERISEMGDGRQSVRKICKNQKRNCFEPWHSLAVICDTRTRNCRVIFIAFKLIRTHA